MPTEAPAHDPEPISIRNSLLHQSIDSRIDIDPVLSRDISSVQTAKSLAVAGRPSVVGLQYSVAKPRKNLNGISAGTPQETIR